jgi:hypothetical protein
MFEEILSKIGAKLIEVNLPYMVIEGQAVLLHGEPRLTRDIDITLGVDATYLSKLLNILPALQLEPLPKNVEGFVEKTMVLPTIEKNTYIRVDFIFSFTPYERQAINRAKKVKIKNQQVNFASAEDLIIHKVFAGRPRDLEDIRSVLIKNPDIDVEYIKKWLRELGASSGENFEKVFNKLLEESA